MKTVLVTIKVEVMVHSHHDMAEMGDAILEAVEDAVADESLNYSTKIIAVSDDDDGEDIEPELEEDDE